MQEIEEKTVQCKHYVTRKKRFCRMTVREGFEYCGEHIPSSTADKNDKTVRIVCPLDNKHTCFAHKLEKHLKVCNARPVPLPYIKKGINGGNMHFNNTPRLLSNVEVKDLQVLIEKIEKIYKEFIDGNIKEEFNKHPIVEKEMQKPEYGAKTRKHLIQASSIVGLLEANNFIQNDTCYIEFGAGKGHLSYWLSQAIKNTTNSMVLLVERASHRHKQDNKLEENDSFRVRADIADLILQKVDVINKYKEVVGVTKHLCGDATDFTIRCLENFENSGGRIRAIIMSFCCHHRCTWNSYTGKEFFEENKLTVNDFDAICGMVSWAICGTGSSRDKTPTNNVLNERDKIIGLTRDQKEEVGRKCKRLLDYGRMKYLEKVGFTCSLKYYVPKEISPENICVVAFKQLT